MKKNLLLALALTIGYSTGFAQDGPPIDADALLKTVEALAEKQSASSKSHFDKVISEFQKAASNNNTAINFYENAIAGTQFMGLSREQTQFQDWKKKEADKLKSNEMQTAARLHLQYLILTLQYSNGAKTKDIIPALVKYTNEVAMASEAVRKEDLMKRSVAEGAIAKWNGVSKLIGKSKEWELTPANIDGIYSKVILPEWRAEKNPHILAYWDMRLQREGMAATMMPAKFEQDQFNFVKRPSLLWLRAKDRLAIGQRNTAIKEMLDLAKAFPDHPENGTWLEELKETIQQSRPAPTAQPSASAPEAGG